MKLPEDWDRPDGHNQELCKLFKVNSYSPGRYALNYRLYKPEAKGRVPLVIYLHGADAVGDDNELQLSMHDIGTMFAKASWQKDHPCYIIAPQYAKGSYWSDPQVKGVLLHLIRAFSARENVDEKRIYIYGYSAGGVGTLRFVKENPGLFAAAISICGATNAGNIDELVKTPLWLVHAEDDTIVNASYQGGSSPWAVHYGSRDIYERLRDVHPEMFYTEYKTGMMKERFGVNPHCSWVAVSGPEGREIREWLFSKALQ